MVSPRFKTNWRLRMAQTVKPVTVLQNRPFPTNRGRHSVHLFIQSVVQAWPWEHNLFHCSFSQKHRYKKPLVITSLFICVVLFLMVTRLLCPQQANNAVRLEPLALLYAGRESRSVVLSASALCHAVALCVTHSNRAAGTLRWSALLKKKKKISWLEESSVLTLWRLAPHIWHSKRASQQMCWHDCLVWALSVFSATCTFFFFFFTHTSVVVTAGRDNGGTISPANTADG